MLHPRSLRARLIPLATLALLAACGSTPPPASPPAAAPAPAAAAAAGVTPAADYAKPEHWLCRPGAQDACQQDLSVTVIEPDGRRRVEPGPVANVAAPVDCFYIYPTVSDDKAGNSDLVPGPEELRTALAQAAPFRGQCRVFAPMYRQVTLMALRSRFGGEKVASDAGLAYRDIVAAWRHYLAHDNRGRGVVLVGHSQGARMATELLKNEIEGRAAQRQVVSALLIGSNFKVPRGQASGGTLRSLPLCTAPAQTGCVVAYVSFRNTAPPPATSLFGRHEGNDIFACTNPAALAGGEATPQTLFSVRRNLVGTATTPGNSGWAKLIDSVKTPFVSVPGLLRSRCVLDASGSYLAISVRPDSRTDDFGGDVIVGGKVNLDWGLHLVDMNVTMGDLVALVGQQGKAWTAAR